MNTAKASSYFEAVSQRFGAGALGSKSEFGNSFVFVDSAIIPAVLKFLKEDHGFNYFAECVGVDYSTWEGPRDLAGRFEVVYNLMNTTSYERLFVKVATDDGTPIPTCKDVFLGAEYPEREINDLLGVVFTGNEQSTRFLLPDEWIGFPLRKEYPLGGEDVLFDQGDRGPSIGDLQMPHAGESFEGKTGTENVSGR